MLLHIFEVGASPEASGVAIRYGAALASNWHPALADIRLVPVATIGGQAAPNSDFRADIQGLIAETLEELVAALTRLENLPDQPEYIDIWSYVTWRGHGG